MSIKRLFCLILIFTMLSAACLSDGTEPLSVQVYTLPHFSFVIPENWSCQEEENMLLFQAPPDSIYTNAIMSAEEIDVSDYTPFELTDLYHGMAENLGGTGSVISIDGHAASFVELTSETGCLCVVLYCRGVSVLAMSATSPDLEPDAIRALLLNYIRYTAYLS